MRALQASALLCALLLLTPVSAVVLWDQPLTGSLGEQMSQDMTDYPDSAIWAFDDVVVTGGAWTVSRVTAQVYDYSGNDAAIEDIRLSITDEARRQPSEVGYPGRLVRPGVAATLVFDLPANTVLGAGRHWLCAWVKGPFDGTDPDGDNNANVIVEVRWRLTTPVRGSQFYLHNPGGGWGYGTGPQPGSVAYRTPSDLAFTVEGTTTCPPQVLARAPKGTAVAVTARPRITFDMPMARVPTQNAFVSVPRISPTFSWKGNAMIVTPAAPLQPGTTYMMKLTTRAKGTNGKSLARAYAWRFTTEAAAPARTLAVSATAAAGGGCGAAIALTLSAPATVRATVCNLAGRTIATLPPRPLGGGSTTLYWNGRGAAAAAPPGHYLVHLEARSSDGALARCLTPLLLP